MTKLSSSNLVFYLPSLKPGVSLTLKYHAAKGCTSFQDSIHILFTYPSIPSRIGYFEPLRRLAIIIVVPVLRFLILLRVGAFLAGRARWRVVALAQLREILRHQRCRCP